MKFQAVLKSENILSQLRVSCKCTLSIKYNKQLSEATKSLKKAAIFENTELTDTYLILRTMRIVNNPV